MSAAELAKGKRKAEMADASSEAADASKKIDPKKQAKLEKFAAKQAKIAEAKAAPAEPKKEKEVPAKRKADKPNEEDLLRDETIKGEKKDLSKPMPSAYHPTYVESSWYEWWEKSGFFKPEQRGKLDPNDDQERFVMAIPPPNVTGSLHLGHALMLSVEDALTRWHRMRGDITLWNPGCDHAGIATQVAVEKKIWAEQKLTRHELGREKFVEKIWDWKNKYGDRIYHQLRKVGASVDWDRAAFTMDEKLSRAVTEAFVQMHERNIIYRSTRLVNWDSKLKTAVSNLEVDYKELPGRTMLSIPGHNDKKKYEFGVLTFFAYKIENSDQEIIVATTRPETMLGDTAIAVNPKDERYTHLLGKNVVHPFLDRVFPIIADDYVDKSFGSGAVKVTPAHDPNDYAIGQRHNLTIINILTDDGKINQNGGQFAGLMRFDAREAILAELGKRNLIRETKDNPMSVPVCSRSGDVIEPLIKPQWYVDTKEMSKAAADAVRSKQLQIIPEQFEKVWFSWLDNPQDWCISRQLWWGHRIPVYFAYPRGKTRPAREDTKYWVSGRTEKEAREKAIKLLYPNEDPDSLIMIQDEDVLDTWFSSGLFPFAIFGWPDETLDMKMFYPNQLLETGHDILFFWVARMVMMGITLTGQVPFKQVYLHAMVRDAHGRKMSKTLGNVIDPLDVVRGISLEELNRQIDESTALDPKEKDKAKKGQKEDFPDGIGECGTDALRFALCAYTLQARDINLDVKRIEAYRNFCNKIWNAVRFCHMTWGEGYQPTDTSGLKGKSLFERWILSRLNSATSECNSGLAEFAFPRATTACYNFWLYEICDVYLESLKPVREADEAIPGAIERKRQAYDVLFTCVEYGLRLLHPFMPFLTEELWQRLPRRPSQHAPSLCVAAYPTTRETRVWFDASAEEDFEVVFDTIKTIRSLRAEYLQPKQEATVYLASKQADLTKIVLAQRETVSSLCRLKELTALAPGESIPIGCAVAMVDDKLDVHLLVKGLVNVEEEVNKLAKIIEKAEKQKATILAQINSPDYLTKIPEKVRLANDTKLQAIEAEIQALNISTQNFLKLKD